MATTPAGVYYPALTNAPNVPADMQALALSIDPNIIPDFANAAARATAITAPQDGQLSYNQATKSFEWYSSTLGAWTSGTWTAYTPTWTAAGTAPSLGNGTLVGAYQLTQGKGVLFRLKLTAGSSTTFGSSAWSFTLPFARAAADFLDGAITGLTNGGSSNRFPVTSQDSSSTAFTLMAAGTATSGVSNLVPFTWASGHTLTLHGCYEAA